jgi:glycosyltransferase involved in cell wall biosynthesis
MSTVSVIIPCYNYAHFLRECVESVVSQVSVEVQVLIIDDASSDNSTQVAAELSAHNSCVEFRRHDKNCGHIATYNEGLSWARGDYTVLLSADDLLAPGALQRATQLMEAHPEVGFAYGGCVRFNTGQLLPPARLPSESRNWKICDGFDWLESVCETGYTWITSPEVVVRTKLQHQLGGYLPELPHAGDQEMWMRFAIHSGVVQILDADQAFYRLHNGNMHLRQFAMASQDIKERSAAFEIVFKNYKDIIPSWKRLRKLADRSLACDALWAVSRAWYFRELGQTPVNDLIKFATKSSNGKFFDLEYFYILYGVSSRILRSVNRKLRFCFGLA